MIKNTKKRNLIINIIKSNNCPISAEEIFKKVIQDIPINLSTIYRSLNALVKDGFLLKDIRQDGIAYFEINDHIHRHHLICKNCGNTTEIENCPFDQIAKDIKEETGYTITEHILEISGLCPKCNKTIIK